MIKTTGRILRSWRDWLIVAVVAVVTFVYFTAGSIALAAGESAAMLSAGSLAIRVVFAIVIGAVMLAIEHRRERPSIDAAILEGVQVAAVVIIANSLFGATETGWRLALKTALLLVGLPLLAVLTHLLRRRVDTGSVANKP